MDTSVYDLAYKHALKNAVEHGGKASMGAVMGKVLMERQDLKEKTKDIIPIIKKAVEDVNALPLARQREEMENYDYSPPKRKEREGLPELPNVEGEVVTRFSPEPGGYIHIGNLRSALVSYLYAKKYKGRFVLRFEDTNPTKPKIPYYDAIREDLRAVGVEWDEEIIESDRMDVYYRYAQELIEAGAGYVCTCSAEDMRKNRVERRGCVHRSNTVEDNLESWDRMLEGAFGEGGAVLRLKVDAAHPNPALRDPVLFRIITNAPHPRTGYKYNVYPLYNFACAVEDGIGVTHVLRGKEHQANGEIQGIIQRVLGLTTPEYVHFGRIHIDDDDSAVPMGKRYIRKALKEGMIDGWGDVRAPTVRSLLKRGILPETLREFIEEVGPKKSDIHVKMDHIYGINRKKLDDRAKRYFFVEDPVAVAIEEAPALEVRIPYHPNHPEYGERVYRFKEGEHNVTISKKDLPELGEEVRLMSLYNIRMDDIMRASYIGDEIKKGKKIQWVPIIADTSISAEILHPSGRKIKGEIEWYAQELKEGDVVQLERVCFARVLSNQGEKIVFYWTHR